MPHRRLALLQIHVAALLAGGTGLFGKFVHLAPAEITFGRTVIGSAVLLAAAAWGRSALRIASRRDLLILALAGLSLAAHWVSFFQSIQVSTVALALLAFATFPLFVTFLEPCFFRERVRGRDFLIALVVVAGLVLVTPSFDLGDRLTQGVLWGVASAVAYAALSLLSRSLVRRYPPVTVAFYQQAFAALTVAPLLWRSRALPSPRDLWLLLLLGTVFTGLAQALIVSALRRLRAQAISVIIALEPVYGILFAYLLLGETPSLRTLAGGALICGAVCGASLLHVPEPAAVSAAPP